MCNYWVEAVLTLPFEEDRCPLSVVEDFFYACNRELGELEDIKDFLLHTTRSEFWLNDLLPANPRDFGVLGLGYWTDDPIILRERNNA